MLMRVRPASLERLRLLFEQNAVGREGDVVDAGDGGQPLDEVGQVGADERLAAGEAQLVDAQLARRRGRSARFPRT